MSLISRVSDALTRVATEFKSYHTFLTGTASGPLGGLNTTSTNLVGAVNEVRGLALANGGGAAINDTTPSGTTTYSGTKIDTAIAAGVTAGINSVVAGAPAAMNTLAELSAALADNANYAGSITTALAGKANAGDVYTQTQLGNPETDLVAAFTAALA